MGARLSADFLVIGSGIAGLRAAVTLQEQGRVLLLTKSDPGAGNTGYAQGGIAAAVGADDSADLHFTDTIAAGDGLCDAAAVRILVEQGPAYVRELQEWGAAFDRQPDDALDLAREGAHSARRVLHARDATGREIGRTLVAQLRTASRVTVVDHALAVQAIAEAGRVAGVRFLDARGALGEARARATLVATGGAGRVFRETTNPPVATGDGVALAYFAGARIADMEFVQFHPTALAVAGEPRYLLSEALRGDGARLVNAAGEAFLIREEAAGDLAPRDRVARAIVREVQRTGAPVFLTLRHLPADRMRARYPVIDALCRQAGLDMIDDPLPVSPAAHYVMGGIETDVDGRTSLAGLYAAGEAACTGVHGANRLASNSLLEGLVFGGRAAAAMVKDIRTEAWVGDSPRDDPAGVGAPATLPIAVDALADLMWRQAGVFRDGAGLAEIVTTLDRAMASLHEAVAAGRSADAAGWQARSLVTVAWLIARAAARRQESRGAHWRRDFPERDDLHWKRRERDTRPG